MLRLSQAIHLLHVWQGIGSTFNKRTVMKKIILVSVLALYNVLNTQAQVRVNVNIGLQPIWGPVGYDYVEYYYIPDCDAYYDVPNRVYIYFDNGVWVHRPYLPPRYRNVDIYRVHKVVINDRDPWLRHKRYHNHYYSYRGRRDQIIIRDAREQRYWQNPGHPRYNEWRRGNDNRGTTIIDRRQQPQYDNRGYDNRRHDNGNHGGHDEHGRGHGNRR